MNKLFWLLVAILFNTAVAAQTLGPMPPSAVGRSLPGQIPGTATNDSAASGNVGEYISSTLAFGSAITLVSLTAATVVSISLTAGDWDVSCRLQFVGGGTPSMLIQQITAISTTTNSLGANTSTGFLGAAGVGLDIGSGESSGFFGVLRVSLAATTTYYCVGRANFTNNAVKAYGIVGARRVR